MTDISYCLENYPLPKIGVIGAGGRLGTEIVKTLVNQQITVVAIASKQKSWGDGVMHHEYGLNSKPQDLQQLFQKLDAVINAAPVSSSMLLKEAIVAGCHVIDVGIETKVIQELLQLDDLAKERQCCLVAMAGLAPGLTGLLGTELLAKTSSANLVDVCLIQNSQGTSGETGTKDMLDLLTSDSKKFKSCLVSKEQNFNVVKIKAFGFDTPESVLLQDRERLKFYTVFDRSSLNTLIVNLGRIRQYLPSVYGLIRDKIAAAKAGKSIPNREAITLSAVAKSLDGKVDSWSSYHLASDYGATAAIACTTAAITLSNRDVFGAGYLSSFVNLETLSQHPWMQKVILASFNQEQNSKMRSQFDH